MLNTTYRAAIEPKQRLAVALRYLASGDSLISLAFSYHLGHTTVINSVHMVCASIEKLIMEKFLPRPTTVTWRDIPQRFWKKWNFPNCLGALDGKHVVIQAPPNSGSQYFNYKKTFSIVLLALVDADYRFRCIQVGDFWRTSDGGVYARLDFGNGYLMRPYPGHNLTHEKRTFNYRLSRARMVVENAFGILASRWRIFHRQINLHPKNVDTFHNFPLAPSDNVQLLQEAQQLGRHIWHRCETWEETEHQEKPVLSGRAWLLSSPPPRAVCPGRTEWFK